jgi:ABC-type enterobactin transport system permease subunit
VTIPPTHYLHDLGPQAQMMAKNAGNERMAMILQYVAIGSMIIMAGAAASQVLREAFGSPDRGKGKSK